jgi:aspartyl protease family protein
MDISELIRLAQAQPLLSLALAAMVLVMLGGLLRRRLPLTGGVVRGLGNVGLIFALLLTIAQVARLSPGVDLSLPAAGMPEQEITGRETRIRMAGDGHFWIRASVNGVSRRFLVDTGATVTAISAQTAQEAEIEPQQLRQTVVLKTANGNAAARLATMSELRVGNAVARNLDAVIVPGIGEMNVLGMNFLSRLKSWRVEGKTLILVPNHPQPVAGASS